MEEIKENHKNNDDSYYESSDFSSDSDENEDESNKEPVSWKIGLENIGIPFTESCKKEFKKSDEISHLVPESFSSPIQCFMPFFPREVIDNIINESKSILISKLQAES